MFRRVGSRIAGTAASTVPSVSQFARLSAAAPAVATLSSSSSSFLAPVSSAQQHLLQQYRFKSTAGNKKPLSEHQKAAMAMEDDGDEDVSDLKDAWAGKGGKGFKMTDKNESEEGLEAVAATRDYNKSFIAGLLSGAFFMLGGSFLFIPFYKAYCSPTGRGADEKFMVQKTEEQMEEERSKPQRKKLLKVRFICDIGNTMPINFVPLQQSLDVLIGEPSLAFYSAYNRSDRTLLGVSSYVIVPTEATPYLNKIQCFCFEEQRFKPRELVEMPVFFYIDRGFLADPMLNWLDEVLVNYTFFNLDRGVDLIKKL